MDSSSDENSGLCTPIELYETAIAATQECLPAKSKAHYNNRYIEFKKWQTKNNTTSISQTVLLAFFHEMAQKHKPTTLWAYYSMLKCTIKINDNIDIGSYLQVTDYLKSKASGYTPVKAKIFSEEDIQQFIDNAPDESWLDVKVVCIFGVVGGCRSQELPRIKLKDIDNNGDSFLVRIYKSKTKLDRSFTITGTFCNIVQKYAALRMADFKEERFFINYQRGKCTKQVIGKHKFAQMPRRIATYLQLDGPDGFTGHSFRRTCAIIWGDTEHRIGEKRTGEIIESAINATGARTNMEKDEIIVVNGNHYAVGNANGNHVSSTIVSQTYNNSLNGSIHPSNTAMNPPITTNYENTSKRKFGEIYCNDMGVLSYQCVLCPAQMDHSDEFSLHYLSHFRNEFRIKEELQDDANILEVHFESAAEPDFTTREIKVEEPQIKSEPKYSGYNDASANISCSEVEPRTWSVYGRR